HPRKLHGKIDIFLRPALASMSLQKAMHFFRQFWSDPFGGRDLLDARFPQTVDRPEFSQEQIFTVLTDAGAIIENAFIDPLLEQQLMIRVRETMRLIPDSLKQMQRAGIDRELQRHCATRPVNLLMLF